MPVDLSPPPAAEISVTPIAKPVDPAFEERWNAWLARGRQRELASRRKLRIIAVAVIALVVIGVLAGLAFQSW
jgi:hypothetical protein